MTASSSATIEATIVAVAAALGGGGAAGFALSGAGASTENRIATLVKAFLVSTTGDTADAGSVTLTAQDSSQIRAVAVAGSLAASFGGAAGISVAIGLSLAFNHVTTDVAAFVKDVDVTTTSGGVTISASSIGATEFVLTGSRRTISRTRRPRPATTRPRRTTRRPRTGPTTQESCARSRWRSRTWASR